MFFWKKKKPQIYCPKCGRKNVHSKSISKADSKTGKVLEITNTFLCPLVDIATDLIGYHLLIEVGHTYQTFKEKR
jgi:hypothetical protein